MHGVAGWLVSCTVSNVELAPLTPLAGVLMPGTASEFSASESVVDFASGTELDLCAFILGLSGSSFLGEATAALIMGGGDFKRGDIGHRGVSDAF